MGVTGSTNSPLPAAMPFPVITALPTTLPKQAATWGTPNAKRWKDNGLRSARFTMEFSEEPACFRDPRTTQSYDESLFQTNDSVLNETDGILSTTVKITIVVVYMVVCVVGLVGNCLVMYVIIRKVCLHRK
ncbi:hypothetical protein AAFF_G00145620 [Aldrovandia affinis]|uniref:Uncharacterized protein n=1 Tax=Aldrovandia affinis TaxID=143900 RepID=A0AAD7T0R3_9TELE|nr:hypothetical protein AAFF_G00145620 [Aldrovandia affinis]